MKVKNRDMIAFPFALITFIFYFITLKIGGEFTAREIVFKFNKEIEKKNKEIWGK